MNEALWLFPDDVNSVFTFEPQNNLHPIIKAVWSMFYEELCLVCNDSSKKAQQI